jgi:mono/diheme cytochrome c family protein
MASSVITVLAVVAGIAWLGVMVVAAMRNRGGEEVAPNLQPGINDQELETRRLEKSQIVAIVGSAFLAVSLPLYFLGESNRQEGFVEEFAHESEERGLHIVEEFACFGCHGPDGVGGVAPFVEPRSGVSVDWVAPPLDDILFRYDEAELNFWITFGRGNTPMPPWGLAGGGPLNEKQVVDVINYLKTIQITQGEAVNRAFDGVGPQLVRLEGADAAMEAMLLDQEQVLAEIMQAPGDADFIVPVSQDARSILDSAGSGLDTDADGLSDAAEAELSALSADAVAFFRVFDPVALDPGTPDAERVDDALAQLEAAIETDPILVNFLNAIEEILATAGEGEDTDGDGISDEAESAINAQLSEASSLTIPAGVREISLDPTNPESVTGVSDAKTASDMVGGLESVAVTAGVAAENQDKLFSQEIAGKTFLDQASVDKAWEIDIAGVAAAMGVSEEDASRAVGLYQANCARCHTASFSAGMPFTREAGSGSFGPALWDGRPVVQFGEVPTDTVLTDPLVDFLIKGSEAEKPYGLNGFGSGRMPGFGFILSQDDIEILAAYLRAGSLNGME